MCNYGQNPGPITCHGAVAVIDPDQLAAPHAVLGAFNPVTNTGVIPLGSCSPNGASVGPHTNVLLGCNPGNNPSDVTLAVINAKTKVQTTITGITGADEVWFNKGDGRYYTGSSRDCTVVGTPCPLATQQTAALGVINAKKNLLIEKIPQSSNSHSVAADSKRNLIFVPQVAPVSVVHGGGDTTTTGQQICGSMSGCVAVYEHKAKGHDHDEGDGDHDEDDEDHDD
jgi:hypothetical protein